jgi:hypothetical protein
LRLQFRIMAHEVHDVENPQEKDIRHNWVNSSRFLFYLQVFCIAAFILGGCYRLYNQRYKGKPNVEVPDNTLYTPKYK